MFNWFTYHFGYRGDDNFFASRFGDIFYGNSGIDSVNYINSRGGVVVNLATGWGSGNWAQGDRYYSIETVYGSRWNDTIIGNKGDNNLYGHNGDDTIYTGGGDNFVNGGGHNDTIYGGSGTNYIYGDIGNDTIYAGSGTGYLFGGEGNDNIYGSSGVAMLNGGNGNDKLYGGEGVDHFDGGLGFDIVYYTQDSSGDGVTVNLQTGQNAGFAEGDTYSYIESITGSYYDDELIGNGTSNSLRGNSGDDMISGEGGDDALYGDRHNDSLYGGTGDDILEGGAGADLLVGGEGADTILYHQSSQAVQIDLLANINTGGEALGDTIYEVESVIGSSFDDTLIGNDEDNLLIGGAGADRLDGGKGNDNLLGGGGFGLVGNQSDGADIFVFVNDNKRFGNDTHHGNDIIYDFTHGIDDIDLSGTEVDDWNALLDNPKINNGRENFFMEQIGDDTVIYTYDGRDSDSITLLNVDMSTLDAGDFIFEV